MIDLSKVMSPTPLCPRTLLECVDSFCEEGCLESGLREPRLVDLCPFCKTRIATQLCDAELEAGGDTCDKPICQNCGVRVGEIRSMNASFQGDTRDFCPECIRLDRDCYERRMTNERREAWREKNLLEFLPDGRRVRLVVEPNPLPLGMGSVK